MRHLAFVTALTLAVLPGISMAQARSPYAGLETRAVKALSEQQINDLRSGMGMSLALAAELNGYPGPRHTLELADQLGLSDLQRQKVQELFAKMKAESIPIGERLIAQESELDGLFARKTITPAELAQLTQAIGATQGTLRATHLKYHLLTLDALTPEQVRRYSELRGYVAAGQHDPAAHGLHH